MLSKLISNTQRVSLRAARMSTAIANASSYKTKHIAAPMDSKFYEKDFISTAIEEIDFVRSPFYELAQENIFNEKSVDDFFEDFGLKTGMINDID